MAQQYTTINNVKHFIDRRGKETSTVVIVIHGGPGGNNYVFQETAGKLLQEHYTLLYYDQRGCGLSEKPVDPLDYKLPVIIDDLDKLIKQVDSSSVVLLGYSFGGQLALEYASLHPSRVKAVIALNPSDFYNYEIHNNTQINGFKEVADKEFYQRIEHLEKTNEDKTKILQTIWEEAPISLVDRFLFHDATYGTNMRTLWMEGGHENTGLMHQALLADQGGTSLLTRIHHNTVPTLVISGKYDRNCGVSLATDMVSKMAHAEHVICDNSAHFPDIEQTDFVVNNVVQFLTKRSL